MNIDTAKEKVNDLKKEAKQNLLALHGQIRPPENFDIERIVDCIIEAAILKIEILRYEGIIKIF